MATVQGVTVSDSVVGMERGGSRREWRINADETYLRRADADADESDTTFVSGDALRVAVQLVLRSTAQRPIDHIDPELLLCLFDVVEGEIVSCGPTISTVRDTISVDMLRSYAAEYLKMYFENAMEDSEGLRLERDFEAGLVSLRRCVETLMAVALLDLEGRFVHGLAQRVDAAACASHPALQELHAMLSETVLTADQRGEEAERRMIEVANVCSRIALWIELGLDIEATW